MIISNLPNPYFRKINVQSWVIVLIVFAIVVWCFCYCCFYATFRTKIYGYIRLPDTKTKSNKSLYKLSVLGSYGEGFF